MHIKSFLSSLLGGTFRFYKSVMMNDTHRTSLVCGIPCHTHRRQERASAGIRTRRPRAKLCRLPDWLSCPWNSHTPISFLPVKLPSYKLSKLYTDTENKHHHFSMPLRHHHYYRLIDLPIIPWDTNKNNTSPPPLSIFPLLLSLPRKPENPMGPVPRIGGWGGWVGLV